MGTNRRRQEREEAQKREAFRRRQAEAREAERIEAALGDRDVERQACRRRPGPALADLPGRGYRWLTAGWDFPVP